MKKTQKNIFGYVGIPGLVSFMALCSGWISILLIISNSPFLAIVLAVLAFWFDSLDGFVARKMKLVTAFGQQLDSLFDFFNYSVFSALFFWKFIDSGLVGVLVGLVILATGAFRLIRFNVEGFVETHSSLYYQGITVCHISLTVILLFFAQQFLPWHMKLLATPIMLVISVMQNSRIMIKKNGAYLFWFIISILIMLIALYFQYGVNN